MLTPDATVTVLQHLQHICSRHGMSELASSAWYVSVAHILATALDDRQSDSTDRQPLSSQQRRSIEAASGPLINRCACVGHARCMSCSYLYTRSFVVCSTAGRDTHTSQSSRMANAVTVLRATRPDR